MTRADSTTAGVGFTADLCPYVPRLVRAWRPDPGVDGEAREAEGTLLSADLSGFTALSERLTRLGREGAEELTNLLNACFDGMIAAMEARGGDVLKFGGDALLVLFTGPEHAARACRAAVATRTFIKTPLQMRSGTNVRLRISQGMHSGGFLLFAVRGAHVEVLVAGAGATESVTCESIAAAGEILLSAASAMLVDPAWIGAEKEGRWLLRQAPGDDRPVAAAPGAGTSGSAERHGPGTASDAALTAGLASFVPEVQREQIAAGGAGEHRRATVGFLKFSHTDRLIEESGGAEVARRLAQLAAAVARAETTHGVHWLATDIYADGGKIILTAGAPVSSGHDEEAMLGALRDVLDAGIELELGAGVNAGPVFVGNVGSHTRRTFTVMGDAVNLAARLMQKADAGQLVASSSVLDATRAQFEVERLAPFLVKGRSQPVHAAVVGRRVATLSRASTGSPLFGRSAELMDLHAAIERARTRSGAIIEVVGDAGIGKTRLVDELRAAPGVDSIGVICGQYAQTSPYFVIRLLLRTLAGVGLQASRGEAGVALARFVDSAAPALAPWLPLLAIPFDAEVPASPQASGIAPAFRRERVQQLVIELLTAAVERTMMFVIDDAHWIDDASRDLLAAVGTVVHERPWIFCVSRRPGAPLLQAPVGCLRIDLGPLAGDAALALALAVAGDDAALRPDEWARIVDHAGGNPLFVIELVSTAVGRGAAGVIPESVESIVTSRMDTLTAPDRLLLRDASVLGMVVDVDLLADALGDEASRSADRWARIESFLTPLAAGQFAFRQELYRRTAYEGLSYRRRRHVHRQVGEALEMRGAGSEHAELLAVHYWYAGDRERSWRYSVTAGDRAREKYANVESATLYHRALESVPFLDDIEPAAVVSVLESLGDVCELGARYDDSAKAYADARRRLSHQPSGEASDTLTLARLLRKCGAVEERRGQYVKALRWYGKGLRLVAAAASDVEQRSARAQLALAYAGVRYRQGRYREMLRWAGTAADDARESGDQAALGHAYFLLELGYASTGAFQGGSFAQRAVEIFEALDDYVGLSRSLNNLGISAWRSGDWGHSLDLFDRSRRAYERAGDVVGAAMAANNGAEILSDQGRLDEAISMYTAALRTCRSARYPSGAAVLTANLGQAEARAGRWAEGLRLLDESIDLLGQLGATGYELEADVKKTEALVLAGRFDEALDGSDHLLARLDANEEGVLAAMLQRQRALAYAGVDRLDDALLMLDDSIERALAAGADYELGRSLVAWAGLTRERGDASDSDDEQRGRALLKRLGVVAIPGGVPNGLASLGG
jgi:class 3 adenylate cyclase/tetratricopeptide (TPR) repeat protein